MKNSLLLALGLLPVVVVADVEATLHTRHWHVLWLGLPLLGLVLIALGKIRKRPGFSPFGVALLLAGAVGCVVAFQWNGAKVQASNAAGDAICAKLEEHKLATGSYPESLEDLVPARFDSVPTTSLGVWTSVPFVYMRMAEGQEFGLLYPISATLAAIRDEDQPGNWSAVPVPW